MRYLTRLRGRIQAYDWGSHTALASLQGRPTPSDDPEAELWLGGHPRLPAEIETEPGTWVPLDQLARDAGEDLLGPDLARAWNGSFPFLFKVLAARTPLSVQAHPDLDAARRGFRAEANLPKGASRDYADPYAKPEILLALDRFRILRGLRPLADLRRLSRLFDDPEVWEREIVGPAASEPRPGRQLCRRWLNLDPSLLDLLLDGLPEPEGKHDPVYWVARLRTMYPGEPAVLAPLILSFQTLEPGEAAFTPPGVLHAYLEGTGLELMVSSDNVVRGGLTSKAVDRDHLVKILRPEASLGSTTPEVIEGGRRFSFPEGELALLDLTAAPDRPIQRDSDHGVEILLCLEGGGHLESDGRSLTAKKGDAFLLPNAAGPTRIHGRGRWIVAQAGPALADQGRT